MTHDPNSREVIKGTLGLLVPAVVREQWTTGPMADAVLEGLDKAGLAVVQKPTPQTITVTVEQGSRCGWCGR